jgi:hypothetical protein
MSGRDIEYFWNLQEADVEKMSRSGIPKVNEPELDGLSQLVQKHVNK